MRTVDLFAGCGGLSLGFSLANFQLVAAYDNWEPAIQVYRENIKTHPIFNIDLSRVDEAARHIQQWNPEMIIGGPPCQDFSHAGKRIEGDRADLTNDFAEIACGVSPNWIVMENVDRIAKSVAYEKARARFITEGYGVSEYTFDASLCGVPQRRKRFFCICHKEDRPQFLLDRIKDKLADREPLTVREYFGNSLGIEYYYRHPRNYSRRGIFSVDEPAPTIRGVNRPVPKGYQRHHNDYAPVDCNLRPLNLKERAEIQTFPSDYIWKGSKTDIEQMVGNAVPIKLAEFVGDLIMEYIRNDGAN